MYTRLGDATLKTGEAMEIGVVAAPDAEWRGRLLTFLDHKPPTYQYHIHAALDRPLDQLQTNFYVGQRDGRVISQVMVVGDDRAGLVGHVVTAPEERRKGAYRSVMQFQMDDVRARGYQVLSLGTGFDSPAYWIYYSFGFRSVVEGSGIMKWQRDDDAEERLFAPGAAAARPMEWQDWPYFNLLTAMPVRDGEGLPRSHAMGVKGVGYVEGPYLDLKRRLAETPELQALTLVSRAGSSVGWATLAPDPYWYGDASLLDLHVHPNYRDSTPTLLNALHWPDAPTIAYATDPHGPLASALSEFGFRPCATLPGLIQIGTRRDLVVLLR